VRLTTGAGDAGGEACRLRFATPADRATLS